MRQNHSLDSKWSPTLLPCQGQRGERAGRHLTELPVWMDLSISPRTPIYHWDLLSTGSAAFPSSCHFMGLSLLCLSNQKALSWFWALPSDTKQNFFPNLLIKSVWPASPLQKEDFKYHVQAPPVSCLQLGKIWCLRGKQTINPSQVLQAETLKHEIWLQRSI